MRSATSSETVCGQLWGARDRSSSLAAQVITAGQLAYAVLIPQPVGNQFHLQIHYTSLLPGHGLVLLAHTVTCVTHVAGLICYLCCRFAQFCSLSPRGRGPGRGGKSLGRGG